MNCTQCKDPGADCIAKMEHAYTKRHGYPWAYCSRCWAVRGAPAPCRGLPVERPGTPAEDSRYEAEERAAIREHGGG